MNKPVNASQVTVQLSVEDAADLQARVERGEFASLDEGVAAELAELNYRRASDIVGGSEKLEALLDALEDGDDPSTDVDAEDFFQELRAGLKERLTSRG
jgi:Arc/MetJ-type ribon-helix-helix transcriptional regulator